MQPILKILALLLFVNILLNNFAYAQIKNGYFTVDNFEKEVLAYQPQKRAAVNQKDFSKGSFILGEVKKDVANDDFKFCYADYWNVTTAFRYLGEPTKAIELAFQKAIDDNPASICEYIEAFGEKAVKGLTEDIPDVFVPFYESTCKNSKPTFAHFNSNATRFVKFPNNFNSIQRYAFENQLDPKLIQRIDQIARDDQRFRGTVGKTDWSKQTPLDQKNLQKIEALFDQYGKYMGRSLVGKKYESVMWAVIQHSNIETMERYLPVIDQAVQSNELHFTPLKMLLDRIYCTKYGYQFFGSQFGGKAECEIAEPKVRQKIINQYNIE